MSTRSRAARLALVPAALLGALAHAAPAHAQIARHLSREIAAAGTLAACDPDGTQPSGALYRICMPTLVPWNQDLALWAHGYAAPGGALAISEESPLFAEVLTGFGYAFATTSYRRNGLAVLEGLEDLVELVDVFTKAHGAPRRVLLLGASEGGLITALAVERRSEVFDGGLALCGPYGDFQAQIDYLGDARVVFDYFFPGVLPPSPVAIPPSLIESWASYEPSVVRPAVESPAAAAALDLYLAVTHAAVDPAVSATRVETTLGLLWYNVFATNDGAAQVGGQPYDNASRAYAGSADDALLNLQVQRFGADPQARARIAASYQTSGALARPLVTLHTTGDEIVPYFHVGLYEAKIGAAGASGRYEHLRVERYGHCNFTPLEILEGLNRLVARLGAP